MLESTNGEKWESAALIRESGIDLRDPKLSITPDDRLMIVGGGSVYEGTTLKGRQPRACFSKDGREWTTPERVLSEGDWRYVAASLTEARPNGHGRGDIARSDTRRSEPWNRRRRRPRGRRPNPSDQHRASAGG